MGNAAAKEPTMEDILSSIRKIIAEEGELPEDVAYSKSAANPIPDVQPEIEVAEPEITEQVTAEPQPIPDPVPVVGSLAQIAAGLQSGVTDVSETQVSAEAEMPEQTDNSMNNASMASRSLADIAAAVKAMENGGEPSDSSAPETLETPTLEVQSPPEEPPVPEVIDTRSAEPAVQAEEPHPDDIQSQPDEPPLSEQEATYIEMSQAISGPEVQPQVVEETNESSEEEEFRGALMSPGADSAVASSFERLKRSMMDDLDAKTESIMRPLLREWLDENLPNMVERLVREEIERVARG